jgi:uncharacterized damage-inducible protein DinB
VSGGERRHSGHTDSATQPTATGVDFVRSPSSLQWSSLYNRLTASRQRRLGGFLFTLDALKELYRHMAWADSKVWTAADATPTAGTDSKIHGLLFHLHNVQWGFLKVWQGFELKMPKPDEFPELASLRDWSRSYSAEVRDFLDGLEPAKLEEALRMPWVGYFEKRLGLTAADPTVGETLFQVTSHSTYHRGQVNARLRELGGEPPLVDFIAWIWMGKPDAS